MNNFVHEDCYAFICDDVKTGCAALAVQHCEGCRFYKPKDEVSDPDTKSLINKYKKEISDKPKKTKSKKGSK